MRGDRLSASTMAKRKSAQADAAETQAQKKKCDQSNRRTQEMKVERYLADKAYGRLSKSIIETKRLDGKLLREHVMDLVADHGWVKPKEGAALLDRFGASDNAFA